MTRANTPQARVITLVVHGPNRIDVHEGERFADHLCWDEMLGQVASLTHPAVLKGRYDMLTPEEWAARRDFRRERCVPSRQLPTGTVTTLEALQLLVKWHARRGGPHDQILPASEQSDEIRLAMAALERAGALVPLTTNQEIPS